MTQTLSDTGEHRTVGDQTRDLRDRLPVSGEATTNLSEYARHLPPTMFRRPPVDETAEIKLIDRPILAEDEADVSRVVELLTAPGQPKPPLPLPNPNGPPRPSSERVAAPDETEVVSLLGALGGRPDLRRSVPYALPADREPFRGGRHRRVSPFWARVRKVIGGAL